MGQPKSHTDSGMVAATAEQIVALANPTRVRMWTELGSTELTLSQLARRLAVNKGSVSHHLTVLVDVDLVRRGNARTVRGGTEQYYARVAERLVFPHQRGPGTASHAVMTELLHDVDADRDPHVHRRHIRLTPAQAAHLADHLDHLLHNLQPADDRHPLYGVATAVYRKS